MALLLGQPFEYYYYYYIQEYSVVPAYTFMYTMMIKMNKEIFFATCVLGKSLCIFDTCIYMFCIHDRCL